MEELKNYRKKKKNNARNPRKDKDSFTQLLISFLKKIERKNIILLKYRSHIINEKKFFKMKIFYLKNILKKRIFIFRKRGNILFAQ